MIKKRVSDLPVGEEKGLVGHNLNGVHPSAKKLGWYLGLGESGWEWHSDLRWRAEDEANGCVYMFFEGDLEGADYSYRKNYQPHHASIPVKTGGVILIWSGNSRRRTWRYPEGAVGLTYDQVWPWYGGSFELDLSEIVVTPKPKKG